MDQQQQQETFKKERLKLWTQSLQSRFELNTDINNSKKWVAIQLQNNNQNNQNNQNNNNDSIIKYWKSNRDDLNSVNSKFEIIIEKNPINVSHFIADQTKYCYWNRLLTDCSLVCDLIDSSLAKSFQHSALMYAKPSVRLPGRDVCFMKYIGPHPTIEDGFVVSLKSVSTPLCPPTADNTRMSIDYGFSIEPFSDNGLEYSRVTICLGIDFKNAKAQVGPLDNWTTHYIQDYQTHSIQLVEKLKIFSEMETNNPTLTIQQQKNSKKKKKPTNKEQQSTSTLSPPPPPPLPTTTSSDLKSMKKIIFIDNNNIFHKKKKAGHKGQFSNDIDVEEIDQFTSFKKIFESPFFSINPHQKCQNITNWVNSPAAEEFINSNQSINQNITYKSTIYPFQEMNNIFGFNHINNNINNNNLLTSTTTTTTTSSSFFFFFYYYNK
ncbi:hypothetical protein DFA_04531 [Cavenderia fasciculata]|uniref:START domain-containing protein n=1 Tax=Cavenderia fasciculata TaxID=261658 RepID=F4PPU7_CACFS|nr:uncharacterized protein DFA_04531 [Cavenderia fasciculata]EGG22410.1 hypothetical protein DFA_04531 [Cavenderia fasciculata]|eukprot:XP_004360261.1 hypothetical protein DFA_04531 [Cavenderia fasciculata]